LAFDISKNVMTVMRMGMVLWEWDGMGTEIALPHTSNTDTTIL